MALGLAAGAGLALQGPVNAGLRRDLDTPVAAAAFSFLVATAAMALVLAGWQAATRAPRPRAPGDAMPWWGWAGGLVGATYVTTIPPADPGDRHGHDHRADGRRAASSPSLAVDPLGASCDSPGARSRAPGSSASPACSSAWPPSSSR